MDPQFPPAVWGNINAQFFAYTEQDVGRYPLDTVLVFVFHDHQFLLANIRNRGWTIPGGRIEPNEAPEAAARREVYEEAGALIGELKEIGLYLLTDKSGEAEIAHWVLVYVARADELKPLPAGYESSGVMHVSVSYLAEIYYTWDPLIEAVCNYAQSIAQLLGWSS